MKKIIAAAAMIALMFTNIGTAAFAESYYENASSAILSEASAKSSGVPASAYDDSEGFFAGFTKDGSVKVFTDEQAEDFMGILYYNSLATKELYDEYYSSEEMTFEEFEDKIRELCGVTEKQIEEFSRYKTVYILSGYYNKDMKKAAKIKAKKAAFEYVKKQVDSGKSKELSNLMKKSGQVMIVADFEADGEFVTISAEYLAGEKTGYFIKNEIISSSGKKVYTLGGIPIASDTESIYISVYDETADSIVSGDAEKYDTVIYDYKSGGKTSSDDNEVIDIKELAKNFPKLKKLHISRFITLKNTSYLSKFKNLKELSIDVSGFKSIDFLKSVKTDKLEITGLDAPAKILSKMNVKEISIECSPSKYLRDIYNLTNVTSLTIDDNGGKELILSGIEKMTGLKALDIDVGWKYTIDLAPIAKIKNLNELKIIAEKTKNLPKIAENKSIRKLMLHSMDGEDLSFLSKMTSLRELSLMYVNSSFSDSLPYLKNCTNLSLTDIKGIIKYSNIYRMKNLNSLYFMGGSVSVKGISALKKLENLSFMLCDYYDLSELKKCSGLKTLVVYNCTTPAFDANDIKGLKNLETLNFNCSEISNYKSLKTLKGLKKMNLFFCNLSNDEMKELKYYLPKCRIYTDIDEEVSADGYTPKKGK